MYAILPQQVSVRVSFLQLALCVLQVFYFSSSRSLNLFLPPHVFANSLIYYLSHLTSQCLHSFLRHPLTCLKHSSRSAPSPHIEHFLVSIIIVLLSTSTQSILPPFSLFPQPFKLLTGQPLSLTPPFLSLFCSTTLHTDSQSFLLPSYHLVQPTSTYGLLILLHNVSKYIPNILCHCHAFQFNQYLRSICPLYHDWASFPVQTPSVTLVPFSSTRISLSFISHRFIHRVNP